MLLIDFYIFAKEKEGEFVCPSVCPSDCLANTLLECGSSRNTYMWVFLEHWISVANARSDFITLLYSDFTLSQ